VKQTLLRIGTALYFSLGLGVMGALAGLGVSFLYPAQYTSSAHIVVPTGEFAGDYPASAAYVQYLVNAALDPQTLSIVIVSCDLYGAGGRHRPLPAVVAKLRSALEIHSHTNLQNASIDLTLTYPDRLKVREALDKVIWLIKDAERQHQRVAGTRWTFASVLDLHPAGVPVRARGLEQSTLVIAGFAAGLLLASVSGRLTRA
jgi:hypothetical protein